MFSDPMDTFVRFVHECPHHWDQILSIRPIPNVGSMKVVVGWIKKEIKGHDELGWMLMD